MQPRGGFLWKTPAMTITCPDCGKIYPLREQFIGKRVVCNVCDARFIAQRPAPISPTVTKAKSIGIGLLKLAGLVVGFLALCIGIPLLGAADVFMFDGTVGSSVVPVVILLSIPVLYFLPYIIARRRRHPNAEPIGVITLFFGWSLVGWVVALAWSVSSIERGDA